MFLFAIGIDILPALFFLHTLVLYKYESDDVDLERFIDLSIIPIFNGVNFLLIIILYFILAKRLLPWYSILIIPAVVLILSYPAMLIGAHIATLLNFKLPEEELLAMRVLVICGWVIVTLIGSICTAAFIQRQARREGLRETGR
jgi:hypothetical protein